MNIPLAKLIEESLGKLSSQSEVTFTDDEIKSTVLQFPASFCLGNCAPFVFNVSSAKFLYMGNNCERLTGISSMAMMKLTMAESAPMIIDPEQGPIVCKLSSGSFETLVKEYKGRTDIQINMDFGIIRLDGQRRRLLIQFRPIKWDGNGHVAITGGYFVDITHIKRLGQPLITINHDGEVLHLFESTDDELVKGKLTSFTLRELEILRLVDSGSTTGEIAAKTGLTKSTIYAHRRNILAKSELPSMSKLISSLKKSGVFSLVGYSSIALLGEPLIKQIFSAAACI